MKNFVFALMCVLLLVPCVGAVPNLQLFIDGATYDWGTQTWVTTGSSFDLYVVSANHSRTDVIVSLALGQMDNPNDVDVNFGGTVISNSDWTYGYAPLDNYYDEWNGGGNDLPRHSIFPTNFAEMHTGDYGVSDHVGNVQPNWQGDYWNPATDEGSARAHGEFRSIHVEVGGAFSQIHFDAYTLNHDGTIDEFAPFSHDAGVGVVPEPGTIMLLGTGLIGVGAFSFRRKKK